jgi:hypothetical protein
MVEFRRGNLWDAVKQADLDLTFLMRAITVNECNVPQIKKLADRISKDQPSRAQLNKLWKQARGARKAHIRWEAPAGFTPPLAQEQTLRWGEDDRSRKSRVSGHVGQAERCRPHPWPAP